MKLQDLISPNRPEEVKQVPAGGVTIEATRLICPCKSRSGLFILGVSTNQELFSQCGDCNKINRLVRNFTGAI